jgi:uncharacterized protein (DUF58 family)
MMPVPSRQLVGWLAAATAATLGVLVFPTGWVLVVAFDLVLAGAAVLDWLLTPASRRLDALRLAPDRLSVLSDQVVAVVVRNHSRFGLRVRVRDTLPETFTASVQEVGGSVPALGQGRWEYRVRPRTRGAFTWGPIHVRYRSLLGFWEGRKEVAAAVETRVYPSLEALSRYHLLAKANRLDALGIRKVRVRGSAWEFESLRDYARGDDVRLIDWKASARRHKTIVRNQEAERNQTVLLLIDCGRLMNAQVNGVAKLDHAVNTALILGHVALGRGDRVGLCTFSHKVHGWVAPRARGGQIRLLTDALYDLRGDFTETDHGRCLRLVGARHPKRALLVVVTDFVDAETASDMVAHLHLAARRYVVLFAALKDPVLEQAARERPANVYRGFRKSAALELLRERRQVLERLRQAGAHVLDVEPSGLTPPVINRYLEIAFRGVL